MLHVVNGQCVSQILLLHIDKMQVHFLIPCTLQHINCLDLIWDKLCTLHHVTICTVCSFLYGEAEGLGVGVSCHRLLKVPHPKRGTKEDLALCDKRSVCLKPRDAIAFSEDQTYNCSLHILSLLQSTASYPCQ